MRILDQSPLAKAAAPLPVHRPPLAVDKEQAKLRDACQQFEAVFLAQLFQKMRDTVPEDPLLGDSRAKDIYYGMMDWELAQQIAREQSMGIAEMLFRQLSRVTPARRHDVGNDPPQTGEKPSNGPAGG